MPRTITIHPLSLVAGAALAAVVFISMSQGPSGASRSGPVIGGRFQIVMRDGVRADTFLVDTDDGRIWTLVQYTDLVGDPAVWEYETRLDTPADFQKFVGSHDRKEPK